MRCLACLFLLSFNVLLGGAQETCCLPKLIEGERFFVESQRHLFFAIDYEVGRLYRSADPLSQTYDIIDLNKRILYSFVDGQCSGATGFRGLLFFKRCLEDHTPRGNLSIGESSSDINVSVFEMQENNIVRTDVWTRRFDGVCIPLFIHEYDIRRATTETSFLGRISATVSGYNAKRLKSDVTKCPYIVA